MMVLCPLCHTSIDSYPVDKQRDFKLNPFNKINTPSGGEIIAFQQKTIVELGGLSIIGDGPILSDAGQTLFSYKINQDGAFQISLTLKDPSGKVILIISDNEWVRGNSNIFDFEFKSGSRYLSIIEKEGFSKFQIDARNDQFIINGCFNMSCGMVVFDQAGITVNGKILLATDKEQSHKFGIMHFNKNAFKLEIKSGAKLTGSKYLSGCFLNFSVTGDLTINPKEIPFHSNHDFATSTEQVLSSHQRLITTIDSCNENIAINDDLSPNKLSARGMLVCDKEISNIFFTINLVNFYKLNNKFSAAIEELAKVRERLYQYYKIPNPLQGEINFDLSKLLFKVGDVENSKYLFEQAIICFTPTGSLPHRLLCFGDVLYKAIDKCYCGNVTEYDNCHQKAAQINRYMVAKTRFIKIINAPEKYKVSIFIRQPKRVHWKLSNEDYERGWNLIFCGAGIHDFSHPIQSLTDLPFALRIDAFGFEPLVIENILRSTDYSIPMARK